PPLGDRRIAHPLGTELLEQAAADCVRPLLHTDFLAREEYIGVALHLLAQGLIQGVAVRQDGHRVTPPARRSAAHPARGRGSGRRTAPPPPPPPGLRRPARPSPPDRARHRRSACGPFG